MPRQARTTSATNVYHAILRGVNKQHLFSAHEEGIGPRTLSRLTGVPYSIVQRATNGTFHSNVMVCEPLHNVEEFETYIDNTKYEKFPDYKHSLLFDGTCPCDPPTYQLSVFQC